MWALRLCFVKVIHLGSPKMGQKHGKRKAKGSPETTEKHGNVPVFFSSFGAFCFVKTIQIYGG